jgi:hypothetical protein
MSRGWPPCGTPGRSRSRASRKASTSTRTAGCCSGASCKASPSRGRAGRRLPALGRPAVARAQAARQVRARAPLPRPVRREERRRGGVVALSRVRRVTNNRERRGQPADPLSCGEPSHGSNQVFPARRQGAGRGAGCVDSSADTKRVHGIAKVGALTSRPYTNLRKQGDSSLIDAPHNVGRDLVREASVGAVRRCGGQCRRDHLDEGAT